MTLGQMHQHDMIVCLCCCSECSSTCWPSCQLHCCLLTFLALVVPCAVIQETAAQQIVVQPSQPAAWPHLPAGPGRSLSKAVVQFYQHDCAQVTRRVAASPTTETWTSHMYCLHETTSIVCHKAIKFDWWFASCWRCCSICCSSCCLAWMAS